jgi:hypothetical protein
MLKRVDDGSWFFAWRRDRRRRERRAGGLSRDVRRNRPTPGLVGKMLMRRVKDGCDYTTSISDVDAPFVPILDAEHCAFAWLSPEETLFESRAEPAAIDDSAKPEIPAPLYPTADEVQDRDTEPPDGLDDPVDEDDIDDELAEAHICAVTFPRQRGQADLKRLALVKCAFNGSRCALRRRPHQSIRSPRGRNSKPPPCPCRARGWFAQADRVGICQASAAPTSLQDGVPLGPRLEPLTARQPANVDRRW